MFEQLATKVVYLDELEVRDDDGKGRSPAYLRAGTRETKNIGLLTCLKRKDGKGGVVSIFKSYSLSRLNSTSLLYFAFVDRLYNTRLL